MKRMSLWKVVMVAAVAFALMAAGPVAAKEQFGIAFLGDLTGPLGFWNAPRLVGIQDAIEYLNTNLGGIGGREVSLDWADTKSKIDIATSGYERLQSKGFPVWHTCGTGEQQILKARYEAGPQPGGLHLQHQPQRDLPARLRLRDRCLLPG